MCPESAHSAAPFAIGDDLDNAIAALQSLPDTEDLSEPARPDTRASMVSVDPALSEVHIPPPPPDDGGAVAAELEAEANDAAAAAAALKVACRRETHAQREAQLEREARALREANEDAR